MFPLHSIFDSVQLIKIAMRNKIIFEKIPRFWRFKQLCARHSYVCRHGLYVIYIVTQTPSFRQSRYLDKSNKFGHMQELTNDNYSEIKLYIAYSILNIRPLNFVLIKKNQQLHSRSQYWNDNEAAPANGRFVNMANEKIKLMHSMWKGKLTFEVDVANESGLPRVGIHNSIDADVKNGHSLFHHVAGYEPRDTGRNYKNVGHLAEGFQLFWRRVAMAYRHGAVP